MLTLAVLVLSKCSSVFWCSSLPLFGWIFSFPSFRFCLDIPRCFVVFDIPLLLLWLFFMPFCGYQVVVSTCHSFFLLILSLVVSFPTHVFCVVFCAHPSKENNGKRHAQRDLLMVFPPITPENNDWGGIAASWKIWRRALRQHMSLYKEFVLDPSHSSGVNINKSSSHLSPLVVLRIHCWSMSWNIWRWKAHQGKRLCGLPDSSCTTAQKQQRPFGTPPLYEF